MSAIPNMGDSKLTKKVDQLERRVQELEARLGIKSSAPANKKPVNRAAYEIAMNAWMNGDRHALKKYGEMYTFPADA